MTSRPDKPIEDELLDLTKQVCDGTISDADRDLLEQLLADHADLRKAYVDYLDVNARLAWRYRTGPTTSASATPLSAGDAAGPKAGGRLSSRALAVAATLLAATAASVFFGVFSSSQPEQVDGEITAAVEFEGETIANPFIATLRESTAAVWHQGADPLEVGGRVAAGALRLAVGRADLVLDSGVRLVIEGPADLSLQSPDAAFLQTGKVAVFVPEHAIGFTLTTPTSKLVDQGTEFGVVAEDSGATEVHVFKGQVDLLYTDDEQANELQRVALVDRQARRVLSPGSQGEGVVYAPDRFRGLADRIAEPVAWPISDGGNGHFYQLVFHENPVSWQQAAIDAINRHHRGLNGHLVTVTSAEEHRFIVDKVLAGQPVAGAWMGLTDVLREGYFRWVTGEPFEYSRWASKNEQQPDNFIEREGHGGEDYGMYCNWLNDPWAWNDLSNDSIHQSISASLVEYEPTAPEQRARSIASEPIGWTEELGGEGQHYRLILALEPLSWDEAAERARTTQVLGVPGHLATLESQAEREFVVQHILKVCGVAENLIGLCSDPESGELRWLSGVPCDAKPYVEPNIPSDRVYGQLHWLDGAWRLQTVAFDRRPAGWFGYLVEYPHPDSSRNASAVNMIEQEESPEQESAEAIN